MLRKMATKGLQDTPRVQRKRLEIIDLAMELFVQLERERPGDKAVRRERARLHRSRER